MQAGFGSDYANLTRGDLGSNGTPEEREREAEAASLSVLGASWRVNLGWPTGASTAGGTVSVMLSG